MSMLDGDVYVAGTLSAERMVLAAASVANVNVQALADIDASKLEHQYRAQYAQESATDAVSEARVIVPRVYGATGTILSFRAGNVVAAGATTTVTVDLLKNGSSVLTAPISLDSTTTAYTSVAASFASTALVVGDVLEVEITLTGSNEPKGVYCVLDWREDAQ